MVNSGGQICYNLQNVGFNFTLICRRSSDVTGFKTMVRGPNKSCGSEIKKHATNHRVVTSYDFVYFNVSIQINSPTYGANTGALSIKCLVQGGKS